MLIETIVVAFIIGLLIKREWTWITQIQLEWTAVMMTAFFIETMLGMVCMYGNDAMRIWIIDHTLPFHTTIYCLLFVFVIRNRRVRGIPLIAIGFLLNAAVIIANKGFMPVDDTLGVVYNYYDTLNHLYTGELFGHTFITESSKWLLLADVINVPPPYWWPKTISLGDIFIDAGIVFMVLSACLGRWTPKNENNLIEEGIK